MLLDDKSSQADNLSLKGRGSECEQCPILRMRQEAEPVLTGLPSHTTWALFRCMPFWRKVLQRIFQKVLFLPPKKISLRQSSFRVQRGQGFPHSSRESPPPCLHVKCLVIKKHRLYMDTESFEQRPRLQKRLLCMDVLRELDFCVLTLMAPSRYVIKLLFFVSS